MTDRNQFLCVLGNTENNTISLIEKNTLPVRSYLKTKTEKRTQVCKYIQSTVQATVETLSLYIIYS